MDQTPLKALIDQSEGAMDESREALLNRVTNAFIIAPDRYYRPDMEIFDLLLTRTANAMDQNIRRVLAMALVRAGARDEHVRLALTEVQSPLGLFLRRSVLQNANDLFQTLRERSRHCKVAPDAVVLETRRTHLPDTLTRVLYSFISENYLETLAPKVGADRIEILRRTVDRIEDRIITNSEDSARDETLLAEQTIQEWQRRKAITEELISELLEAHAMTEFIFALSALLEFDTATIIRVLNDTSFESLAIVYKAKALDRSLFAKTIFGFRQRVSDQDHSTRALELYTDLPTSLANEIIEQWRSRISAFVPSEAVRAGTDGQEEVATTAA